MYYFYSEMINPIANSLSAPLVYQSSSYLLVGGGWIGGQVKWLAQLRNVILLCQIRISFMDEDAPLVLLFYPQGPFAMSLHHHQRLVHGIDFDRTLLLSAVVVVVEGTGPSRTHHTIHASSFQAGYNRDTPNSTHSLYLLCWVGRGPDWMDVFEKQRA